MNSKKILAFCLAVFMICFNVVTFVGAATSSNSHISFTAKLTNNSNVEPHTEDLITAETSDMSKNLKTLYYKIVDSSQKTVYENTHTSSSATGSKTLGVRYNLPYLAGTYEVTATVTDVKGTTKSVTYTYTIKTSGDNSNMTITNTVGNNVTVDASAVDKLIAKSSNNVRKVKKLYYKVVNASGSMVDEGTLLSDLATTSGSDEIRFNYRLPSVAGTYKVIATATDMTDVTKQAEFSITIRGNGEEQTGNSHLTITNTVGNNVTVDASTVDKLIAKSSNSAKKVKKLYYKVVNASGSMVDEGTLLSDLASTTGSDEIRFNYALPSIAGTYKVIATATDMTDVTKQVEFVVTIRNVEKTDSNSHMVIYSTLVDGSTVAPLTEGRITITTTDLYKGMKTIYCKITDSSNRVVKEGTKVSDRANIGGNVSMNVFYNLPEEPGTYKVYVKGTDIKDNVKDGTFTFTVVNNSSNVTITANPTSGSTVERGSRIVVTARSSSSYIRTISYSMYREDGTKVRSNSTSTVDSNGKNPLDYEILVPSDLDANKITLDVVATTVNGVSKTEKFEYNLVDGNGDGDDHEGVLNPDLDGLAVDLWTVSKSRFFQLDEEVDFVAYYYNAENKDKDDVVLEIEVPDGFKVKSYNSSVGTKSYKSGIIKFNLGKVAAKTLGKVVFTLVPEDDDLCESVSSIVATIKSKGRDEDTSTQRIWIYETGDSGSFVAYITGYPDGSFRPDNAITREEAAAMLARAFGHTATNATRTFTDVNPSGWAYRYIVGCANKNIITGYADGTFKPHNNIQRSELYAMIYRAMGISPDEKAVFVPKEYKKASSWEKNYIAGLTRLRMFEEMDNTTTELMASRSEVVYLINRVQFRNPSGFSVGTYSDVYSHWCAKDIEAASVAYSFKRTSNGRENRN